MHGITQKIYLSLTPPTQEDFVSDQERILRELRRQGIQAELPLSILQSLYPFCPRSDWKFTVSLAYNGSVWSVVRMEAGDTTRQHYGICADLGSTTLVMQLIDCGTGQVLGEASAYNHQIPFGEDILTRIFYAKDQPEHLAEIRQATLDTFQEVLTSLTEQTGILASDCISMVVAGNTTMIHFLLGMDAFCVFSAPYAVHALDPGFLPAREFGFSLPGYVYCYPGKANYLGGDIISGAIATGIHDKEELSLFFDIGTNGELIIGNREFLLCGAGAAGPALEGGVVKTGMRAVEGAVERLQIQDGVFHLHTINNAAPVGICGSGIVDMLAQLFLNGWITIQGKFVPDKSPLIHMEDNEYCVTYAPGLCFYQSDIDEFLKTKAAAVTMIHYMLDLTGISPKEISHYYMAGAFGAHISKESAVTIGMYPDVDREKLVPVGNASLKGAKMLLLDCELLDRLPALLENMEYVQFGAVDNFINLMVAATAIPHTNLEQYPSLVEQMKRRHLL